jgi:hypothetical protein
VLSLVVGERRRCPALGVRMTPMGRRLLFGASLALLPWASASADTLVDALTKAYAGNPNLAADPANLRRIMLPTARPSSRGEPSAAGRRARPSSTATTLEHTDHPADGSSHHQKNQGSAHCKLDRAPQRRSRRVESVEWISRRVGAEV